MEREGRVEGRSHLPEVLGPHLLFRARNVEAGGETLQLNPIFTLSAARTRTNLDAPRLRLRGVRELLGEQLHVQYTSREVPDKENTRHRGSRAIVSSIPPPPVLRLPSQPSQQSLPSFGTVFRDVEWKLGEAGSPSLIHPRLGHSSRVEAEAIQSYHIRDTTEPRLSKPKGVWVARLRSPDAYAQLECSSHGQSSPSGYSTESVYDRGTKSAPSSGLGREGYFHFKPVGPYQTGPEDFPDYTYLPGKGESVQEEFDTHRAVTRKKGKRRGGSDGEERTEAKARKICVACNFCRIRKLRCDGGKPCFNCRNREQCEYVPYPRRRGPGKAPKGTRPKKRNSKATPPSFHLPIVNEWDAQTGPSRDMDPATKLTQEEVGPDATSRRRRGKTKTQDRRDSRS